MNLITPFFVLLAIQATGVAAQAKIVNRKVKDAPKVCSQMFEDRLLSKEDKRVYGTLKHSVVIERNISVVNDLGKKVCQWDFNKLNSYGSIDDFNYYIDEYKNYIYPYLKNGDQETYTTLKISLTNCEIEEKITNQNPEFPKCETPKKRKIKKQRALRTARR